MECKRIYEQVLLMTVFFDKVMIYRELKLNRAVIKGRVRKAFLVYQPKNPLL